jgi:hypothetical protein
MCGTIGALLGATAGWAKSQSCLSSEQITDECLIKSESHQVLESASSGLFAGTGAALTITIRRSRF